MTFTFLYEVLFFLSVYVSKIVDSLVFILILLFLKLEPFIRQRSCTTINEIEKACKYSIVDQAPLRTNLPYTMLPI